MPTQDEAAEKVLSDFAIDIVGRPVVDGNSIYVQVNWKIEANGSRTPSKRTLLDAKEALASRGLALHVQLVSSFEEEFEILLRATLFLAFPDVLRNVFCSSRAPAIMVWIEPKQEISAELIFAIEKSAKNFCESQAKEFLGITLIGDAKVPGKTAILAALRQCAPASAEELNETLIFRGFTVPSLDFLKRRLDSYRKTGNILFTADKKYTLTMLSLRALGTSKSGARSPDVSRLLALWKRNR